MALPRAFCARAYSLQSSCSGWEVPGVHISGLKGQYLAESCCSGEAFLHGVVGSPTLTTCHKHLHVTLIGASICGASARVSSGQHLQAGLGAGMQGEVLLCK